MSLKLLSHNPDLNRLCNEGYAVRMHGAFLALGDIPYVNNLGEVKRGTLISSLDLAGDLTQRPSTHVVYFDGDYPCNPAGQPLEAIRHQTGEFNLGDGLTAKHMFSSKPQLGYSDYYEKMSTYASILAGQAATIVPGISPKTFVAGEDGDEGVFHYTETASARVGIAGLTELLVEDTVAIIGLGGTGSYVLDLVAKTPVREIRLFDGDQFLTHNAFRSPGAPALEDLRLAPNKVDYFGAAYNNMHRMVIPHAVPLNADTIGRLAGVTFAFICIDGGQAKRLIIQKLEEIGASFVDVGMGLELTDGSLGGILRVTASTPDQREHVHDGRVSFADSDQENLYSSNIQVADLNCLNAALAVIKWKKLRKFYRDFEREHQSTYTTDTNMLFSRDQS